MARETKHKILAVISGGVGEGKSTTLFNLGYVYAEQGSKVLIVDTDLRRPVQHKMVGLNNRIGVANVLTGEMKAEGDLAKLVAMQMEEPSEPQKQLAAKIAAMTA